VVIMVDIPVDRERYGMDLRVSDAAWKVRQVDFFGMGLVVVEPPSAGSRAEVTIEVTRVSDGRKVPVELTLESVAGV
jgi:hypothetical protein